ncbi:MAG: hypothetical protein DK306_002025 [Chloroflexi bacterium]|nr:MAG: hypothetical protein DK306_002025 [Chloroflexota bacterium]
MVVWGVIIWGVILWGLVGGTEAEVEDGELAGAPAAAELADGGETVGEGEQLRGLVGREVGPLPGEGGC